MLNNSIVLYGFFFPDLFISIHLFKMDDTVFYLQQQHEMILKQNDAIVDGLNVTLDFEQILLHNQNVLALISQNQHYMLLLNFLGIMLIAFSLIALSYNLEKITKRYEEECAIQDGAYAKIPDA